MKNLIIMADSAEAKFNLLVKQNHLLIKTLEIFEDVCINCLNPSGSHDDNGEVDMIDEIGRMVCGNPLYPAQETLKLIKGSEKSK